MKNYFYSILILLNSAIYSQFEMRYPDIPADQINDIQFLNESTGFFVNSDVNIRDLIYRDDIPLFSTRWDTIYTGLYFNDIIKLDTDTLIAATSSGIFISSDNGNNWIHRSNRVLTNLLIDSSGQIYGFYNQHIFISDNRGFNWTLVNFVLNQGYITSLEMDKNNNLWAVTNSPSKLFKSSDSGLNWDLMYSTPYEISDIDFDSMNNIYMIAVFQCLKSTDGGINWTVFFEPQIFSEIREIEINPNDEIYLITYQEIFHTSNNGLNWRTLNGMVCHSINSIYENKMLIIGDRAYISAEGDYWFNIGLDIYDPFIIKIYCIDSVILASYYNILAKYNPNGEPPVNIIKANYLPLSIGNKWLYRGGTWDPPYSTHSLINSEAISEQMIGDRRYVFVTGLGWLSYSDKDKLFFVYQNGFEIPVMDFRLPDFTLFPINSLQNPDDLYYHKIHSGYIYQTNIHTKGYSFPYFEGVIHHSFAENLGYFSYSNQSGLYGWTNYSLIQALIFDSTGIQQLYDYTHNPQIIFTPITKTKDTLLTFTLTINHQFSVDTSNYVFQGLNFIDSVFMIGFYVSEDDTLPFNTIYSENIYGTKKFLFNVPIDINLLSSNYKLNYRITARDKGIVPHWDYKPSDSTYYQMIIDSTLSVEDQVSEVFNFQLNQNYPNPFNPSTIISYQLPVSSDVTLKVYDVLGREIVTLVNEEKPAGEYEVEFDASQLSSGIYFYKLQTENFSSTKKMIYLK